ncbi:activator of HSP90 ATPase [Cytophagales bacterium WSM2-2]|nr:activator of HSP90 ATPase [Cytophagales bacterium WSM2-2]
MAGKNESTTDREIKITRVFDAPRNLLWSAWTEQKHVINWWGPTGFTNTIHQMEVKAGGVWDFIMHGPDGTNYPNKIVFTEVVKPELLKFDHGSDNPNDPGRFKVTVNFKVIEGNKTELTMQMIFLTKEARDLVVEKYGAIEGNRQTMARLEEYLKTMTL